MNALMTKYGKYCTHVNTQLHVYFKHDVVGYQTVKLTKVISCTTQNIYDGLVCSSIKLRTMHDCAKLHNTKIMYQLLLQVFMHYFLKHL